MQKNSKKSENESQNPLKLPETWFLDKLEWLLMIKQAVLSYEAEWDFQREFYLEKNYKIEEENGENGKEIEQCANPRPRIRHQDEYRQ